MRTTSFAVVVQVLVALPFLVGCTPSADWKALFAAQLQRTVLELDESYLNREFEDDLEGGALTRVAWARLDGGELVFLGLPPYGLDRHEVVRRTVVLGEREWTHACGDALGEPIWAWSMPHTHRGNAIRIVPIGRSDVYCDFYYLPRGWEVRTVHVGKILKPAQ